MNKDAYFIIDDCISEQGREGFIVFYGDPWEAVGTRQGEFSTLWRAVASIPVAEPVYRVFLARRHGEHKVKPISRNPKAKQAISKGAK